MALPYVADAPALDGRGTITTALAGLAAALPARRRSSDDIERQLRAANPHVRLRPGTIFARTGITERRVAEDHEQCSDLAVQAARTAMQRAGVDAAQVDLLVFAAASQDLIEPATAHIVQHKLGTQAAVLDVKNACNSFLNGLQVADALLRTGQSRCALVVTGEICSRAVRWQLRDADDFRLHFPGYTMGDAGAAAVLLPSGDGRGLRHLGFAARSEHWPLAMIRAGGSMFPRGDEYAYLSGDGPALKDAFVAHGPPMLHRLLAEAGYGLGDFDRILVHQVGVPYHQAMLDASGIPASLVERHVDTLGNLASASLPVAHALAVEAGRIRPGDRVLWLGMASGISVGIAVLEV